MFRHDCGAHARSRAQLPFVMLGIDCLTLYNDYYGHFKLEDCGTENSRVHNLRDLIDLANRAFDTAKSRGANRVQTAEKIFITNAAGQTESGPCSS